LRWLLEEKVTYAPIGLPDKLNQNKQEVQAKANFVETENKFAPFMVCEHCDKLVYAGVINSANG